LQGLHDRMEKLARQRDAFFAANRDEEMSAADIALKFDATRNGIEGTLQIAVKHEWLCHQRSAEGALKVYCAGPNLPHDYAAADRLADTVLSSPSAATSHPWPQHLRPGTKPPRRPAARNRLPELAVDELPVSTDRPVPLKPTRKGESRYDKLLDRLATPGASVLLPRKYQAAVQKASMLYGKRTGRVFTVRVVDAQQCGVWRTA
jgi:hypothetical protein